ncbi:NAD(P)H-dependent oxidoreductase [Thalassobaculum litoreum]|uniref:NADPH-quinone reductase (Modulator of drug activity B) n=1 Tax=Thalassobaculum litoreum DSM 18839 TaxID=1123362 RepID=A0A8G2BEL7_9PROT|nr:NAD(P)H-dependent oxidoreductase [Thalassobaculum litoreum]SDF08786.1 Putative NADPH-quinone reductase (modulator of drug activity B) [Thalassobaculum litoreum DSM 18839]
MSRRIFIWVAHPKENSLCRGMADAYQTGVEAKGGEVRRIDLCDMRFDLNTDGYGADATPLEPDLIAWQEAVAWADHILIVHPYWWGAMPTKAKAVIDRALAPGFAFKYHRRGLGWDKLLTGKTADVMITSDTPPLLDTLLYWRPGRRVLINQILGFCGVKTRRALQFGSVKTAAPEKIRAWIDRARTLGVRAAA